MSMRLFFRLPASWCAATLGLFMLLGLSATAWAGQESLCVRRFKQKHYLLAAKCFQRLADAVDGKSSEETRMQAGNWLRNAALAYKQAAAKEKDTQRATFLREKGLRVLQRYLKEKMYRTQTQQRIAKSMLDSFEEKIGYVTLTILPGDPKATVQIIGFRYKKSMVGGGATQVRPGKYTVMVVFSDKRRDAKALDLKPSTPKVLRFGQPKVATARRTVPARRVVRPIPPPVKSKGSVGGWVIAGIGGAALVAGVVLVAVSVAVTDAEAATLLSRAKEANDPVLTKEAGDAHASASTQYIVGWIVTGVGAAALAVGIGLGVAGGGKAPPPTTTSSLSPRTPHSPQRARIFLQAQ